MKHLTARQLCAFLDDALVGTPDDETARHLGGCALCRTRYETWLAGDEALRDLLSRPPDEQALEQWSSWVERVVTAERKGLGAPELAELRLPLPPSPPPPAPEVPRVGIAPRPSGPARFATQGAVPQGRPEAPIERVSLLSAPIVNRDRIGSWPRGADPPPGVETPDSGRGPVYARLPGVRSGWLDRLAERCGPPQVWAPLVLLLGLLACVPFIPVLIRITLAARSGETAVGEVLAERAARPAANTAPPAESTASSAPESARPLLCGEVLDAHGAPIEGARVTLESDAAGPATTASFVITDGRGRFCVACPPGRRSVRIEAPGHAPLLRAIEPGSEPIERSFTLDAEN